jgi:molecular chaperone HtpG
LLQVDQAFSHTALAIRIARILEEDYFLPTEIRFGKMSGNLPILVTETGVPAIIYLDPDSTNVATLIALYREDFDAFGPFVKDFVRTNVFPRVSNLVPSSTREGAEAFLRRLRAKREWFEYELDDQADLYEEIWQSFREGNITLTEATNRLTDTGRSVIEVTRAETALLSSVVIELDSEPDPKPDHEFDAQPGIDRRESETGARILTSEAPLNGYRCFLSLSDRVQREKGDFFLQPHTTEIVWGGQKVLFIFQHHSGRFGLYYDILCSGLVGESSGGGPYRTSTIVAKSRTFIPIPEQISGAFLPQSGERKRMEVKCDVIYIEAGEAGLRG